ncbi:hypothetical protein DVH24_041448 [Malus domestica]|uniref:Uncharacterized protein n=1 Tax=Malus domestica TaxID=3750 RepID=A0A498IFK0_MALDO|nr:hypothetical protein DVH24_041448 [Malus domestica]
MAGMQNMEGLASKFGSSLFLSEREKGGVKIEKKAVEGSLLGFHYSVVPEMMLVIGTGVVARAICGLLGTIVKVDKDDGTIEFVNHPEEVEVNGESIEMLQPSRDIDLNMPIVGANDEVSEGVLGRDSVDGDMDQGLLYQDSDSFNLFPIIEVVSKDEMKKIWEDAGDDQAVLEDGLTHVHKIQRFVVDQAEATCEGSLRLQ